MVSGISGNSGSGMFDFTNVSSASSATGKSTGILETFLENYVKSFSTDAETNGDKKKEMLKDIISKGDKDCDNGLSLSELNSIDTNGNSEENDAVNSLISQFKSLDKNSDGVLSLDEMQGVKLKQRYSIEELSQMYNGMKNSDDDNNSMNIYSCLEHKLINNYNQDFESTSSSSVEVEAWNITKPFLQNLLCHHI